MPSESRSSGATRSVPIDKSRRDMTPEEATTKLLMAAKAGDLAAASAAIDAGADINAMDDRWHQTPLHSAAANEHADLARLLIEKGADINAMDDLQHTPLHMAAEY